MFSSTTTANATHTIFSTGKEEEKNIIQNTNTRIDVKYAHTHTKLADPQTKQNSYIKTTKLPEGNTQLLPQLLLQTTIAARNKKQYTTKNHLHKSHGWECVIFLIKQIKCKQRKGKVT